MGSPHFTPSTRIGARSQSLCVLSTNSSSIRIDWCDFSTPSSGTASTPTTRCWTLYIALSMDSRIRRCASTPLFKRKATIPIDDAVCYVFEHFIFCRF